MRKRSLLIMLLALLTFFINAQFASAEIICSCSERNCICFIQMGDEGLAVKGIIKCLAERQYLSSDKGGDYDRKVFEAVIAFQREHGLAQTGMMDDKTLTLLIWGTDSSGLYQGSDIEVWVPTDGGEKRHSKKNCSNMYDPRKMSSRNAEALGMDACKRCKPQ